MRHFILLASSLLFFNYVFSQSKSKEYFLQKSKNQKTTAWILLSTGTAAVITGAIMDNSHKGEEQSYTGGFVEVGGIICTLTSIPFFISSSKNKKRAMTVSMNSRKILLLQSNSFVSRVQPSVSLHMSLIFEPKLLALSE
jgi:hypothetical protein